MVFDERLCGGGEMHPVAIPEQDDVPGCEPQHLLEKRMTWSEFKAHRKERTLKRIFRNCGLTSKAANRFSHWR